MVHYDCPENADRGTLNIQIRDVTEGDLPAILRLNEEAVPQVSPVDMDTLSWFGSAAAYFRVAEAEGVLVGFLIAVAQDSGYPSKYFQWFCQRYTRFIYIDRVIVAEWARGNRIAWRLCEDVERFASELYYPLASDVYSYPPNEVSLSFHDKYGFQRVGSQLIDNGTKEVAKFLKGIPSRILTEKID
jgi:predicted GNAT superfamily acetyltransferase